MTRPGIERRSSVSLANTLSTNPMSRKTKNNFHQEDFVVPVDHTETIKEKEKVIQMFESC